MYMYPVLDHPCDAETFCRNYLNEKTASDGSVSVNQFHDDTHARLFLNDQNSRGFLFPTLTEYEEDTEMLPISNTISLFHVKACICLPTAAQRKRRWWICLYNKAEAWNNVRKTIHDTLKPAHNLSWRKVETPWIIRNGIISVLEKDLAVCIARAEDA